VYFLFRAQDVGSKIRRRKSNLVLDEIEEIIGYGFERINIADDFLHLIKSGFAKYVPE